MKHLLLLLFLLPASVKAGEIELPKFDIPWHQQGSLSNAQSDRLTKFLQDGLQAAKEARDQKLIQAYEEIIEIHMDDPLNPNPLEERGDSLSAIYKGHSVGFERASIKACMIEEWNIKADFLPVRKVVQAYANTKMLQNVLEDKATCEDSSVTLLCEAGDCGVLLPTGQYGYFPAQKNAVSIVGKTWTWKGELPWWISKEMWSALRNKSTVSWELVHWPYSDLVTGSQETYGNTKAKNLVYSRSLKTQ